MFASVSGSERRKRCCTIPPSRILLAVLWFAVGGEWTATTTTLQLTTVAVVAFSEADHRWRWSHRDEHGRRNRNNHRGDLSSRIIVSASTDLASDPGQDFSPSSSSSSSWKNLWSIDECLEKWNLQQQQQQQQPPPFPPIQFVDATWFHKGDRNGKAEFEEGPRLPGAVHWDTGELSVSWELFPEANPQKLRNVFPPEWMVGVVLETQLGITSDTTDQPNKTLVVYGREGTLFAPRVWYLLHKYYQNGSVKLLEGPMEAWIARGGPVDNSPCGSDKTFSARDLMKYRPPPDGSSDHPLVSPLAKDRLVDKAFVLDVVEKQRQQRLVNDSDAPGPLPPLILDTRGSSFGKSGHIPGALHLPYSSFSLPEDTLTLKANPKEVLEEALGPQALERLAREPALLTCGTGVSVCTLALVLEELGYPDPWIYDGSWDEWGKDPSTPKEGGA